MSAKKAGAKAVPPRAEGKREVQPPAPKKEVTGLEEMLAHAKAEVSEQLRKALEKQEKTGERFTDILRRDVDREMLRKVWTFLNRPIQLSGKTGEPRLAKDILVESGRMTKEEVAAVDVVGSEDYDPQLADALVGRGVVTREQIDIALAEQRRTGDSFWRILVNRGFATPKQIADARKYGMSATQEALDEAAWAQSLLRTGLVTRAQLDEAIRERRRIGGSLSQIVLDLGAAKPEELGPALARQVNVPYINLKEQKPDPAAVELLPEHLARQNRMIPVRKEDSSVLVAMSDPTDLAAKEQMQMLVNLEVRPALSFEKDIMEAIEEHYRARPPAAKAPSKPTSTLDRIRARLRGAQDTGIVSLAESVSIVNLVAGIIEGAINSRATDIHLEPQATELRVRYRIDGVLYDVMNLPGHLMPEVVTRIKVLANMDITEKRHPQDGHFTIEVLDRKYDLRVATLPTVLGEKLVLRLLNPEDVLMGLKQLGLEAEQLVILERMIRAPHGMILVTGPIGSGKTTTLYSALSRIDILTENIVTIEDPVEYQLPGINQVQVDPHIKRTFADVLRAVLRQDADTLLVGEIRDVETAQIAVRAAMTGHLVFSTLHTNDALGAIITLRNYNVPSFLIASAVICLVAQRLVRKLCEKCKTPHRPERIVLREMGISPTRAKRAQFYEPVGCDACFHTGYHGRTGIFEVCPMDKDLEHLILQNAPHSELKARAIKNGMITLHEAGIRKVEQGITSLSELARVTQEE